MTVDTISDIYEICFPKLGWTFRINPTAFSIGGFPIQWYGIIIVTGLILAMLYCFPKMRRFGVDSDRAVDAVIGGVIGGIIGARLYYVIWKWDEYKWDFKSIINTRNGGLAIYGGIIGALLVGLIICKIRKVKMLPMLDITVLGFLIGQGIGRWGNFVNQEAFGSNTDSFLGMTGGRIQQFLMNSSDASLVWNKPVHPCFLYESLWCILGFVLLSLYSKRRKYDGQIFLMYLAWYGAERFVVEGLRTDSLMLGNARVSQVLSVVICVTSIIVQIVMFSKYRRDPESCQLYAHTEESRLLLEESLRRRMGMSGEDAKVNINDIDDDENDIFDDSDDEMPDDDSDKQASDTPSDDYSQDLDTLRAKALAELNKKTASEKADDENASDGKNADDNKETASEEADNKNVSDGENADDNKEEN